MGGGWWVVGGGWRGGGLRGGRGRTRNQKLLFLKCCAQCQLEIYWELSELFEFPSENGMGLHLHLPLYLKITALKLGQTCDYPSANEVTLKDMDTDGGYQTLLKHNEEQTMVIIPSPCQRGLLTGTWRNNNVIMTSKRRRFGVIMTLSLRRVFSGLQYYLDNIRRHGGSLS